MNQSYDLDDILRSSGRRLTPQRRLVLDVLEASSEHLDAEDVYERVKAKNPEISLATVYRTLAMLKEIGLVEEHHLGQDHGHYEAVRDTPHYHFTCTRCGKVFEFDTPLVTEIEQNLVKTLKIQVDEIHLHITGLCAECQTR